MEGDKKHKVCQTRNISKNEIVRKIQDIKNQLNISYGKDYNKKNQFIIRRQRALGLLYIKNSFLYKNNYDENQFLSITSPEYKNYHELFVDDLKKTDRGSIVFGEKYPVDQAFKEVFELIGVIKPKGNKSLSIIKHSTMNHYLIYHNNLQKHNKKTQGDDKVVNTKNASCPNFKISISTLRPNGVGLKRASNLRIEPSEAEKPRRIDFSNVKELAESVLNFEKF